MHRIPLAAAVAIAAAVAVPSVASGATIHQDGRTPHRILFQDETGETNLVTVEGKQSVLIHDTNVPITIAGVPTCMPLDAYTVSCAAVRRLELDLGVGPDHAIIDTPHPVSLEGGAGSDRYVALATGAPSRVDFDGGIGLDTANYFYATAGVHVAVDLEAGDGRPGDDDQHPPRRRVRHRLRVRRRPRRQRPHDAAERRATATTGSLGGTGPEELLGGAGNDRIDARDGASDTIDCGGQTVRPRHGRLRRRGGHHALRGGGGMTVSPHAVGELDLWVERRGDGPDVLLIAGLGDPAEAWQLQLDGLADRYRVTAFDNRGVGRTPLADATPLGGDDGRRRRRAPRALGHAGRARRRLLDGQPHRAGARDPPPRARPQPRAREHLRPARRAAPLPAEVLALAAAGGAG